MEFNHEWTQINTNERTDGRKNLLKNERFGSIARQNWGEMGTGGCEGFYRLVGRARSDFGPLLWTDRRFQKRRLSRQFRPFGNCQPVAPDVEFPR